MLILGNSDAVELRLQVAIDRQESSLFNAIGLARRAVRSVVASMSNRRTGRGLTLASATGTLQVLEVAVVHRRNVFSAKDAHLELLRRRIARRKRRARSFQIRQILVDHSVCIDDACNVLTAAVVRNEFARCSQVDAINVDVTNSR